MAWSFVCDKTPAKALVTAPSMAQVAFSNIMVIFSYFARFYKRGIIPTQ
jgi:hypothetical protein